MRTKMPVLADVDLGAEFRAMVDAVSVLVPSRERWVSVLLDDLPDSSARLDLVRLAVLVALERNAEKVQVLPVTACYWYRTGTEWSISRVEPARGFVFVDGKEQPSERTVTLTDGGDGFVRVTVNGARIEVPAPSEQECLRLLEPRTWGTTLRFPVFPSQGSSMVARGDGPDELVLWRCGTPTTRFRLPGPVLAATYVSSTSAESLTALIEVDRELVVHVEGDQDSDVLKLRAPIDFSVADEAEHDLSPLGLTTVDDRPALLTREADVVRARTADDVRTVVAFAGPVLRHHGLPWVAVQRSTHLVEVLDIATGAVLHRVRTGDGTTEGPVPPAGRRTSTRWSRFRRSRL